LKVVVASRFYWSFSKSAFKYRLVDHAISATCRSLAAARFERGLLHTAVYRLIQVALDPLVIHRGDIAQRIQCIVGHGRPLLAVPRLATFGAARFGAVRALFCWCEGIRL